MSAALEIGESAEQYLAEGSYELALDKFQSSLKVLVPLLGKEPPGRRRELLSKQVIPMIKHRPAPGRVVFSFSRDRGRASNWNN